MKNYGTQANEANWGLSPKEAVAFSLTSHHPSVMMGNAGHHERRDAEIWPGWTKEYHVRATLDFKFGREPEKKDWAKNIE